jgi:hypothetical protein
MRNLPRVVLPLLLLALLTGNAAAQGMPTSQPGVLTVIIEELKPGVGADHEANESGWPVAFEKAKSPYYYLALEALTGPPELWFVAPYQSWAAEGESMKLPESNAALAADLAKLAKGDGPFLNGYRSMQAIGRPDLSYGTFPDIAMARFYEVTTFRVRPGHEQAFEAAAKLYAEMTKRSTPGASYRTYQVTAGMPGGTYLIFGSTNAYAEFDKIMADGNAMWSKATPQEMATMQKVMADDIMSVITQRYRVSPTMSYVSAEAKAKDPKFWSRPRT